MWYGNFNSPQHTLHLCTRIPDWAAKKLWWYLRFQLLNWCHCHDYYSCLDMRWQKNYLVSLMWPASPDSHNDIAAFPKCYLKGCGTAKLKHFDMLISCQEQWHFLFILLPLQTLRFHLAQKGNISFLTRKRLWPSIRGAPSFSEECLWNPPLLMPQNKPGVLKLQL